MKNNISIKQLRDFGLLIGFGFPLIIGWFIPFVTGHDFRKWSLIVGLLGLFFGLVKPKLLLYPYKTWMKLGFILGWFNSRLILGLVYLLVLLPIAFFMRIFGYDPLGKNRMQKNHTGNQKKITKSTFQKYFKNGIFF